jgi:uncharacterized protein (DUF58 family)
MKLIFDAANSLTQEIERTRQHLAHLEQALAGLKPLMGGDSSSKILTLSSHSFQSVEDATPLIAQVINAETVKVKPSLKKIRTKKKEATKDHVKLPVTGADLWLSCIGRKKFSQAELVDLAIQKLKLDEDARVVITNRAGAWLYAAVKKGTLTNAGVREGIKFYTRTPKPPKEKTVEALSPSTPVSSDLIAAAE